MRGAAALRPTPLDAFYFEIALVVEAPTHLLCLADQLSHSLPHLDSAPVSHRRGGLAFILDLTPLKPRYRPPMLFPGGRMSLFRHAR